jgi:hypothetical protein
VADYLYWLPEHGALQEDLGGDHSERTVSSTSPRIAAEKVAQRHWDDAAPDYPRSVRVVLLDRATMELHAVTVEVEYAPVFVPLKSIPTARETAEFLVTGLLIAAGGPHG